MLAIAGTGYGLIGILVIILLVVLIFYFVRPRVAGNTRSSAACAVMVQRSSVVDQRHSTVQGPGGLPERPERFRRFPAPVESVGTSRARRLVAVPVMCRRDEREHGFTILVGDRTVSCRQRFQTTPRPHRPRISRPTRQGQSRNHAGLRMVRGLPCLPLEALALAKRLGAAPATGRLATELVSGRRV